MLVSLQHPLRVEYETGNSGKLISKSKSCSMQFASCLSELVVWISWSSSKWREDSCAHQVLIYCMSPHIMLNIEPTLISTFYAHKPISLKQVSFWSQFFDPHQISYHWHIGVQMIVVLGLGTSTLVAQLEENILLHSWHLMPVLEEGTDPFRHHLQCK